MSTVEKGRVIPFWFWNDQKLDQNRIGHQMDEIAQKGITEIIIHPRFGLGDYLNENWFHHVGVALNKAEELKMKVWFTDEKSWPSGTAGGKVTEQAEFRAKVAKPDTNGKVEVSESTFHLPYQLFDKYVDVLSKEATIAFIKSTHQEYYDRFSEHFARGTISGFYCDEPGMYANLFGAVDRGAVPYSAKLPKVYEQMHNVSLEEDFRYIWGGDEWVNRTARLRYFQTLGRLYQNNFLGPLRNWCSSHGVFLIGHILGEEDPLMAVKSQADPFSALGQFNWAGYDLIGGFSPQRDIVSANFARSVAKLYGQPEVLTETFGSFGWGLTVDQIRDVNEWQMKNGATVLIPHALFSSLEGSRKHDAPPSLMEPPFWDHFAEIAKEFKDGVSHIGKVPKFAVYYPTLAIQAAYNPANESEAKRISRALQEVCGQLESFRASLGIDLPFDLLNDDGILQTLVDHDKLYLPRSTVIPIQVIREISGFSQNGGEVIFYDGLPRYPIADNEQGQFDEYLGEIIRGSVHFLEARKIPKLSIESALSSSSAEGLKYFIWHTLSAISPALEARYSQINGKLEVMSGYFTRRLTGIERFGTIAEKIKGYLKR